MDPATVILVLATHLVCFGGLFLVVARQLPPRCGITLWGSGGIVLGLSFVSRLAGGLHEPPAWAMLGDIGMFAAVLLLIGGLYQFLGQRELSWGTGAALLAVFVAIQATAMLAWGLVGRYTVINLGLGLEHLWIATLATRMRVRGGPPLRRPLLVLAIVTGGQGLAASARGAYIALMGTGVVYAGVPAQLYYGFSSLATVLQALILLWLLFARLNGQLAEMATRDPLTRLFNRSGLDEALERHFAARTPAPLTVLALDIDHFKRINDTLGHAAGDAALQSVAAALARGVRPTDIVARLGGEEFVVCCPAIDAGTAQALAERLRRAVAALSIPGTGARGPASCTVSIGISSPFAALADWARAADEADRHLYAAKAAGRDRVVAPG